MSKAVYYFCADNTKDPVSNNVFQCLTTLVPMTETDIEVDGYKVFEHTDEKGNLFQFVRIQEVLSHNYQKYLPYMQKYFSEFDFAGLVNWHEGANAPEKVLTVHSTGDVPSGIFGATNSTLFKNLIIAINQNRIKNGLDDFITSTEATHWSGMPYHGKPEWITDYTVPIYDVEIGSYKSSWQNENAIKVLASSLCSVFTNSTNNSERLYTLLCVGGVHFEESFSKTILSETHPLSIGHILPNQWLIGYEEDVTGLEKFERSVNSVIGGIHAIVFHDNIKSIYKQLCKIIGERHGVSVFKHKTLRDLDRTLLSIKGTANL
ncbi:MAG: D-aminoacyl-tRNA deacylase [Treponema sp.]|nr:D-aminoacyl-tRNA deacylase [Treponema sp.]